jgi:hypothetical protein
MAREHEHWVISFFEGLDEAEKQQLHALLARLKQHVARLRLETGD